jgi:hypothetical protein
MPNTFLQFFFTTGKIFFKYSVFITERSHTLPSREKNTYRGFVGKNKRKRPLPRTRRRWEDNITTNLTETGWGVIRFRIGKTGGLL